METSYHFTTERAIEIQGEQLAKWKRLLKPHIYIDLERWATKINAQVSDGRRIRRGDDLTIFVLNYHNFNSGV